MVFLFCVKQKTAYERRISEWGSDVCSSDLVLGTRHERADLEPERLMNVPGGVLVVRREAPDVIRPGLDQRFRRGVAPLGDGPLCTASPSRHVLSSEERRGAIECVSTWRSRWSRHHNIQNARIVH